MTVKLTNEQREELQDVLNDLNNDNWQAKETAQFTLHRIGPSVIPVLHTEITRLKASEQALKEVLSEVLEEYVHTSPRIKGTLTRKAYNLLSSQEGEQHG